MVGGPMPIATLLRKWMHTLGLVAATGLASGFAPANPDAEFTRKRLQIQKAGMISLTAWGVGNIGVGTGLWLTTPADRSDRYFHQMNALWNTVNVTLGVIGWVNASREQHVSTPIAKSIQKSKTAQTVFAVNLALDFGYITAGALSWDIGLMRDSPRAVGYGQAVVLQGCFLLVFDALMLGLHHRHLARFEQRNRVRLSLGPGPGNWGLGLSGSF